MRQTRDLLQLSFPDVAPVTVLSILILIYIIIIIFVIIVVVIMIFIITAVIICITSVPNQEVKCDRYLRKPVTRMSEVCSGLGNVNILLPSPSSSSSSRSSPVGLWLLPSPQRCESNVKSQADWALSLLTPTTELWLPKLGIRRYHQSKPEFWTRQNSRIPGW